MVEGLIARIARVVLALCLAAGWPGAPVRAQADTGRVAEQATGAQVLGCVVGTAQPIAPAVAAEGGFEFEYQALAGTAADGRACTVHRLRNAAGAPPTPVRWRAGSVLLVEQARLGRCGDELPCAWVEVARYFDGEFGVSGSVLGFGVNADTFRLTADSLVAVTRPDLEAVAASIGTEVSGAVGLADERLVQVEFIVRSRLVRDGGSLRLVYELETDMPELGRDGDLALVWEAIAYRGAAGATALSDTGSPFLVLEPSFEEVGEVVSTGDKYLIEVLVDDFEFRPELTLSVVARERPDEPLLTVPMPAFLPVR